MAKKTRVIAKGDTGYRAQQECTPAVQSVAAVLADGGVLFGGTIVVDAPAHTRLSRALIRSNNRRGIFGNENDTSLSSRHPRDAFPPRRVE